MSKLLLIIFSLLIVQSLRAQSCPPNIGFESGNFQNWSLDTGTVNADGTVTWNAVSAPLLGRHTLIKNTLPYAVEVLGGFPKTSPNNSGYAVQLGTSYAGKNADRLSYTIHVPANTSEYNILIYYALVFDAAKHEGYQLSRFDLDVIDEATEKRIECLSFNYLGTSGQPGVTGIPNTDVYYRKWSAIPLQLTKYAGKTLRLQFTAKHCVDGLHSAYAYIDINENCGSFISGNILCNNETKMTLTAPVGFTTYKWMSADFSKVYGTESTVTIDPAPANGTKIALEVSFNPWTNCKDTFYTTVQYVQGGFTLNVPAELKVCPEPFDLTAPSVTQGSSADITLGYYADAGLKNILQQPKAIEKPGVYYIKAENNMGCTMVKGVQLTFLNAPQLKINTPPIVCAPNTVDLTNPAVTKGSDNNLSFTYWTDADTTKPLLQPNAVGKTGIYYIKAYDQNKCSSVQPVIVSIPDLSVPPIAACGEVVMKDYVFGSDFFKVSFWQDANATVPVTVPDKIYSNTTYYVKGEAVIGCTIIKKLDITVYPLAMMIVNDPPTAYFPATVDITRYVNGNGGQQYMYWRDPLFSVPLVKEKKIDSSGTYYITAKNMYGCSTDAKIRVVILPPPPVKVTAPNVFSPNNDGINDRLLFTVEGTFVMKQLRIYDRWSHLVFQTNDIANGWNGTNARNQPVTPGTYYWVLELSDFYAGKKIIQTGSVTVIR